MTGIATASCDVAELQRRLGYAPPLRLLAEDATDRIVATIARLD